MSGSLKDLDYLINKLRKIVPVNLQEILDSKSEIGHNHNTIYYLKNEIDELLNEKVDIVVGKQLSTNDFTNALKEKLDGLSDGTFSGSYTDLTDVPTTFTPSTHNHNDLYYTEAEVTSLLLNKQNILISGINIKTINSTSILGSGNIVLGSYSNIDGGNASSVGIFVGIDGENA